MKRRAALTPARLAADYGRAVAERLMREWGGHRLPRLSAPRAARDQRIRAALDAGESCRSIARRERLHAATVCRIGQRVA